MFVVLENGTQPTGASDESPSPLHGWDDKVLLSFLLSAAQINGFLESKPETDRVVEGGGRPAVFSSLRF